MYVLAGQRITKRLTAEDEPIKSLAFVFPTSPVQDTTFHILLTRPRLIQDIGHDLELIVQFAKSSSSILASHVALDAEFVELLPDLYEMVSRTMIVGIPCEGKKTRRNGGLCTGPAQVQVQVTSFLRC